MGVLPTHVCLVPEEARRGHQLNPLELELDGCELPYGCWERNQRPLEEQPVLPEAEPSLQPFLSLSFSVLPDAMCPVSLERSLQIMGARCLANDQLLR